MKESCTNCRETTDMQGYIYCLIWKQIVSDNTHCELWRLDMKKNKHRFPGLKDAPIIEL